MDATSKKDVHDPTPEGKRGFLRFWRKHAKPENEEPKVPPVSFFQLFRLDIHLLQCIITYIGQVHHTIRVVSEVSQEEIEAACRNANILEFIQSLPKGFETEVGGKGSQLSGSEKQRIAIAQDTSTDARNISKATSVLDSASEKVVRQALDMAAAGRTTIAITHRLSTIQNADRIYFLKDGIISESGTHDELLNLKGDYSIFVRLQALEMSAK
ncbi:P-loop containing nucleoside triphosphate hydrolase protein [Mycena rebaudengoi]|nr:P-loop containing nucleoside triphosphate hydrolase protein [Mycena rebaudengoi]